MTVSEEDVLAALDASLEAPAVLCSDSPEPGKVPECGLPAAVLVYTHPFGACEKDRERFEWVTLCQRHFDEIRGMLVQVTDRAEFRRRTEGSFVTPYVRCASCARRFKPEQLLLDPKPIEPPDPRADVCPMTAGGPHRFSIPMMGVPSVCEHCGVKRPARWDR